MRTLVYVLCSSLAVLIARPTFACTCAPPPPPAPGRPNAVMTMRDIAEWSASSVKVIFEGQVERQDVKPGFIGAPRDAMSMTLNGAHRVVTVRWSRVYRGPSQQTFTVLTGMGNGDCGFDFETGKEYLIYADPMASVDEALAAEGDFFTSICTGTALLEHAGPALRFLRGEPPAPDDLMDGGTYLERMVPQWTGTVCGHVTGPDGKPAGEADVDLWTLSRRTGEAICRNRMGPSALRTSIQESICSPRKSTTGTRARGSWVSIQAYGNMRRPLRLRSKQGLP